MQQIFCHAKFTWIIKNCYFDMNRIIELLSKQCFIQFGYVHCSALQDMALRQID